MRVYTYFDATAQVSEETRNYLENAGALELHHDNEVMMVLFPTGWNAWMVWASNPRVPENGNPIEEYFNHNSTRRLATIIAGASKPAFDFYGNHLPS